MEEISGVKPEQLPPAEDIKKVKAGLKGAQRDFVKQDGKKLLENKKKKDDDSKAP